MLQFLYMPVNCIFIQYIDYIAAQMLFTCIVAILVPVNIGMQ